MNKLEKALELIKGAHFAKAIALLQEAIQESSVLNDKGAEFLNASIVANARYSTINDLITKGVVSAQQVAEESEKIAMSVTGLIASMKAYEEIMETPDPASIAIEVKLSKSISIQANLINNTITAGIGAAIFGITLLILSQIRMLQNWSNTTFVVGLLCVVVSSAILFMFRKKGTEQLNQAITNNIKTIDELQELSINLIQIIKGLRRYITGNITEVNQFINETSPSLENLSFLPATFKNAVKDKQFFLNALQTYSDELEEVISNTQDALIKGDLRKLHAYRQTTSATLEKIRALINTSKNQLS